MKSVVLAALLLAGLELATAARDPGESAPTVRVPGKGEQVYNPLGYVLPTAKQIEEYERYASESPADVGVLAMLALLYVRNARETAIADDYAKAERTVSEALKLEDDHFGALYVKMLLLAAGHRFRESLELAEKTYERHPVAHHLLMVIGDAQLEIGDVDLAERSFLKLEEKLPRTHLESRRELLSFEESPRRQSCG